MKNWEKTKNLLKFHDNTFRALGVTDALYLPKMFYTPKGKEEVYVSFFTEELKKGKDIYTEMVSRELESEDQTRTLYKWVYNELWPTQYEKTVSTPIRYLIPKRELEVVSIEDSTDCLDEDCGMSEMSIRDFAAIIWSRPVASKSWLNELIGGKTKGGK